MKNLTKKQQEIFAIAVELFYTKGFADTSMRDIAEAMQVKAASLYSHIKSKEEILLWISEDIRKRFTENFYKLKTFNDSIEDKFNFIVLNHLVNMYHDIKRYDVFFTNIFRLKVDFKNQNEYLSLIESYVKILDQIIREYLLSLEHIDKSKVDLMVKFSINILNNVYRYIPQEEFNLDQHSLFLKNMLLYGAIGKN